MSTKITKILTAMIIFTATLILNVYSVYAVEYTVSDLFGNTDPDLYCIQGGHHFFATVDGEKDYSEKVEDGKDENGNTKYKWVTRTRTVHDLELTGVFSQSAQHGIDSAPDKSVMEQKLAYALAHGSGYNSNAQQYLWRQIRLNNSAVKGVLAGAPVSSNKGSMTGLDSEINNYVESNKKASITRHNTSNSITTENYKIGPFAVSYDGTPDTVTVKGKDENGNIVTLNSNEYDILQNGQIINASQIQNKRRFYIINKSTKEITSVKVHVTKKHTYYKVKYYVLVGTRYRVIDSREYDRLKSINPSDPQSMIKVKKDSQEHHTTTEAEYEFKVKIKKGNLELSKFGTWGENGESKTEKLSGMKFKVYCKTLNKWIKSVDSNPITFTDSFDEAKEYTTDRNGKIKINGLYSGSYVYTLVETEGNKGYYIDPIVIEKSTSNKESDETVGHMTIGQKTYCTIENVTVFYKAQNVNKIKIVDNRSSGDLTIVKQDYTYNDLKLEGAEFKLQLVKGQYIDDQNKWLMGQENGSYNYTQLTHDKYLTSDINKAGTFVTDKEGKISLKGIVNGTYKVYETKTPDGYDITKQDGYEKDDISKQNHWVYRGEVTVSTGNNIVEYKLDNKKIVDKLEGDVWIDRPVAKETQETDNIYNSESNDIKYSKADIPVILYDKVSKQAIAKTVTDSNGHYEFATKNAEEYTGEDKNIYYWDLANSYVEFRYDNIGKHDENGMVQERGYVVVNPFTGNDEKINSKAQGYEMVKDELEDSNLTGIDGNHPGRARTNPGPDSPWNFTQILENEKASQKDKLLTGFYNHENYKVENINLGLIEREEPDFSIREDIAYMKVSFGDYTYKYKYMEDDLQYKLKTVPTVQEQNTSRTFTGSIYPSDIAYNIENPNSNNDGLKVYVVYRIIIYNNKGGEGQVDNNYVEESMYVSELVNTFKSDRYEVSHDTSKVDDDDVKKHFELWSKDGNGETYYNVNAENSAYYAGIKGKEAKESYVQFKLKNEAVEQILKKQITGEDLRTASSTATATTYHEYWRADNLWNHKSSNEDRYYKEHRKQEYNEAELSNKTQYLHKSLEQTRSSSGLYMRFDLPNEERTILGVVFEDEQTDKSKEDRTMLGNGEMETEENRVGNATVEMDESEKKAIVELVASKDKNATPVTLYPKDLDYNNVSLNDLPKAIVKDVPVKGEFKFEGVIPGYYYVRFTYGDGRQRLYDINGNIVKDSDGKEIEVKSNDYRSTIISNQIIQEADKASDKSKAEWYKEIGKIKNFNTATDDLDLRASISHNGEREYQEGEDSSTLTPTPMMAYTPKTSITIEDDEDEDRSASQVDVEHRNDDGTLGKINHYEEFTGFNFGIIKVPNTELKLQKKIVNAEFKTQTGSTLVSDNPKTAISPYLSDLDKKTNGGSIYAKIEIDPSLVYGSELKTTYEITVTNNSTVDYSDDYYFKYGTDANTPTITTVTNVRDLLDEKYDYESLNDVVMSDIITTKTKTGNESEEHSSKVKISKNEDTTETEENDGSKVTKKVKYIDLTGWSGLKTSQSESIQYTVSGLLQTSNDDTLYNNDARITKIQPDKFTTLPTEFKWDDAIRDETRITITPTTGADRSNMYWIAGAIALAVLATGIVIIKKRVLK